MGASYSFQAELWLYPGEAAWHFLTLPPAIADDIRARTANVSKAFGSVRVSAEIAGHAWHTSVFPDSKSASYLLPVKKAVRDRTRIHTGDTVQVKMTLEP